MSLLEVLVSIAVLVIGLSGFLHTIVTSSTMESTISEHTAAASAARATIERMRATPFAEVFARFNASADDDPAGGVSPGPDFAVEGLRPLDGQPATSVGRILFPATAADPGALREDLVDASLGTPLDLDADGVVDGADHSGNYRLLPVVVRIQWESRRGPAAFELRTVLGALP